MSYVRKTEEVPAYKNPPYDEKTILTAQRITEGKKSGK
jgi:hypothetical protein